jgi:hypothetical protein
MAWTTGENCELGLEFPEFIDGAGERIGRIRGEVGELAGDERAAYLAVSSQSCGVGGVQAGRFVVCWPSRPGPAGPHWPECAGRRARSWQRQPIDSPATTIAKLITRWARSQGS